MRNILFRGKDIEDNKWALGCYWLGYGDKHFIHYKKSIEQVEIIPDTLSEYTGVVDCNGNAIFEGDIIKIDIATHPDDKIVNWGNAVVEFRNGAFCAHRLQTMVDITPLCNFAYNTTFKIIGNKWDNPELLEGIK